MDSIYRFWNGKLVNKIILLSTAAFLGLCSCCLGGSVLSSLSPAAGGGLV